MDQLSGDPSGRRVLVLLGEAEYDRLDMEDVRSLFARSDTAVLDVSAVNKSHHPIARQLVARRLTDPGTMLVLSPFDSNWYEPVDEAADQLARAKMQLLSLLCQQLGAKSLTLNLVIDLETDEELAVRGDVSAKGVGAKGSFRSSQLEKMRQSMSVVDVFAGGSPQLEAAQAILDESNLSHEPELRALVRMRAHANTHLERTLRLELTSEAKRAIEAATELGLGLPAFLKMKVDLKKVRSETHRLLVEYTVEFPSPKK